MRKLGLKYLKLLWILLRNLPKVIWNWKWSIIFYILWLYFSFPGYTELMRDAHDTPIKYVVTFVLWYVFSILIGVHIAYAQMFRVMRKEEYKLLAELKEHSARLSKRLEEYNEPFNITLPNPSNDAPEATTKI